ncbi:InlB B-repeat-containing protein, partial [Bifidobacterium sp. UTBIF-78]|uniref:InlB B-repeat-containing protein n=1 Tax=Bifidobacterium sp. UTBIF-78 TaxID=1465263 RepID=UPI00112C59E2
MTGNNKVWRAPLAGLASVAMIATMGVAASTANADVVDSAHAVDDSAATTNFSIGVYDAAKPYQFATAANGALDYFSGYSYGDTFTELAALANPFTAKDDHKVLTGYSYDQGGTKVASADGIAVKGDTKLYAQSKKAFTVTFKGGASTADQTIEVAEGQPITAADYYGKSFGSVYDAASNKYVAVSEPTSVDAGYVFVGWTLSNHADSEDLYQGEAITADTTLYPKFEKFTDYGTAPGTAANQNVAQIELQDAQTGAWTTKYTYADQAFPEYRADPEDGFQWQLGTGDDASGTEYDFKTAVKNAVRDWNANDLKLFAVANASDNDWTVVYHFNGIKDSAVKDVNPTNDGAKADATSGSGIWKKNTTADGKAVQPGDPAKKGAEFTGWYQSDNDAPFDFNVSVSSQVEKQSGSKTVNLYAGWDTENIAAVAYYYNYDPATESLWNQSTTDLTDAKGNKVVSKKTGKALNYQTKNKAIAEPTGVEDYFQTTKDVDYGTYTKRTVTSWNGVLSGIKVSKVTADVSVYAKWESGDSILLDANGGTWSDTGANHSRYVSKTDSQKWADVVATPTRDGYTFLYWEGKNLPGTSATTKSYANLSDGYYYTFVGPFSKTGLKKSSFKIIDGDTLRAVWASTDNQKVYALHDNPRLGGLNKQDDYALWAKYAKSEATWKSYVDTWYSLEPEFIALNDLTGQAKIDAASKLAAKY